MKSISKLETEPNWTWWGMNRRCNKLKNLGFDPALIETWFSLLNASQEVLCQHHTPETIFLFLLFYIEKLGKHVFGFCIDPWCNEEQHQGA